MRGRGFYFTHSVIGIISLDFNLAPSVSVTRGVFMTSQELQQAKVELLDEIHELAADPVADPEPIKQKLEAFFQKLEAERGEEGN